MRRNARNAWMHSTFQKDYAETRQRNIIYTYTSARRCLCATFFSSFVFPRSYAIAERKIVYKSARIGLISFSNRLPSRSFGPSFDDVSITEHYTSNHQHTTIINCTRYLNVDEIGKKKKKKKKNHEAWEIDSLIRDRNVFYTLRPSLPGFSFEFLLPFVSYIFRGQFIVGLSISPRLPKNFSFVSTISGTTISFFVSLLWLFFFFFFLFAIVYHIFFCQHNFSSCTHNEKHLIFDSLTSLQSVHVITKYKCQEYIDREREREIAAHSENIRMPE